MKRRSFALLAPAPLASFAAGVQIRYLRGRSRAARAYDSSGLPRDDGIRLDLDSVQAVSVLPLVDWYASRHELGTEPGISYLIRADDVTILFDLGLGGERNGKSILLHNMTILDVDPTSIDLIVISHPHSDHMGGTANRMHGVATIRSAPDLLAGKPMYTTVPLRSNGTPSTVVYGPRLLAPGVASTGPLPVQLYGAGYTMEQALIINVAGRGLVIILGCGHPGVEALVERAQQVVQKPVYAVIGGMHLPITDDRVRLGPIRMQRLMASTTPPWRVPGPDATERVIRYLEEKRVGLVSPSAHDSCDWSLKMFARAFGDRYRPLLVGKAIPIESRAGAEVREPTIEDAPGDHHHA